jgi:hypothetical protein
MRLFSESVPVVFPFALLEINCKTGIAEGWSIRSRCVLELGAEACSARIICRLQVRTHERGG